MSANFPAELPGFIPIRRIGSGGFGDVWLAEQSGLDREVAIKVSLRRLENPNEVLRFERECRALGRLSGNPNIVDVYTSGLLNDSLPYLVMEYIDGGTLKSRAGDLDEGHLRRITAQLCKAMQAAHDVGVLHRDMKPDNVFLRANGDAVIGDFGIARVAESGLTSTGIPATLLYVAPEILKGEEPTQLSDVYGVGITIASAILGMSPFAADNSSSAAVIGRVLHAKPASLGDRGISPEFVSLIESAMAKDPRERPQSATELHARLSALGSGIKIGVDEPNVGESPIFSRALGSGSQTSSQSVQDTRPSTPLDDEPGRNPLANPLLVGLFAVAAALVFLAGALLVSNSRGGNEVAAETSSGPEVSVPGTLLEPPRAGPFSSIGNEVPEPSLGSLDEPPTPEEDSGLPLDVRSVSGATGLADSEPGFVVDESPANSQLFCGNRPVIGGLLQTAASKYRPQSGHVVSQRVAEFSSESEAIAHVESFTSLLTCESWLTGDRGEAKTIFTAVESFPDELFGDQIFQFDEEAVLPNGGEIFSRVIVVRRGSDVLRISYSSPDREMTNDGAGELLVIAVSKGGF